MRVFICLFALLLVSSCGKRAENPNQEELIKQKANCSFNQLERFNQAFLVADKAQLDSLTTADYLHTNGAFPPITKDIWLAYLERRKQMLEDSSLIVSDYQMDELQIQFYGDAAWVSALVHSSGMRDSIVFDNDIRVSHLWVWENERWKRAAFQDAKAAK